MSKKTVQPDKNGNIATQIRLPEELYWALKRATSRSGRSMNKELAFRLRQSLALDPEATPPPKDEREALSQSLERLFFKVQDFSDLLGEMKDRVDGRGEKRSGKDS